MYRDIMMVLSCLNIGPKKSNSILLVVSGMVQALKFFVAVSKLILSKFKLQKGTEVKKQGKSILSTVHVPIYANPSVLVYIKLT